MLVLSGVEAGLASMRLLWACAAHRADNRDIAVFAEQGSHRPKAFLCCHVGEEAPNGVKIDHLKGSCSN